MDNIIDIKNLTRKFNGFVAVDNISLEVKEGEIFGFLGPNGAGKTTTINILTTQLKPTKGTATITGIDVISNPNEVRRCIGIVFQDPSLDIELTAWENLKFHGMIYNISNEETKKRSDELLQMVELLDRKNNLVKKFSGGMKRRLEVARGLLHKPKILFLDEPTIGLDPQTRTRIWEYVFNIQKEHNMTIFLTTHSMEEAENCSRVAIIDHGKIVALGTPEELKRKTNTSTMNDVFLKITGRDFRDEDISDPKLKIRQDLKLRHR